MGRRIQILTGTILALCGLFAFSVMIYISMHDKITQRLQKGWVIPPLELYSQGYHIGLGRRFPLQGVTEELKRRDLHVERDYYIGDRQICEQAAGTPLKDTSTHCFWLKKLEGGPLVVTWNDDLFVQEIFTGQPWTEAKAFALFPRLITQFFDGQPILQQNTPISEIPLNCLQAVTAIEDKDFLVHGGVSATGTLRALMRNLKTGRFSEGGSTITQQLVKNFFLTPKKTIKRKLEEQVLAVLLESELSKDQILEMYLNVIYMGQNGPYQVRGVGSASLYYFDKPLAQLELSECALLAAVINNPGLFSPFTHPDNAKSRREKVLRKMQEAEMLNAEEVAQASASILPAPRSNESKAHAPYFVMTALKEFTALGIESEEGARLYTTLDPEVQSLMLTAAQAQMPAVEARIKKPSKEPLQVAAITVDLDSAQVLALIGGRDFRATQFNRASDSRRQIGSTVKPFVYLPAMTEHDPLTAVADEPFEWKNGKTSWRPKNYDGKTFGSVPYFFALAESLNISAAKVGQEVGLETIAKTLRAAGATSTISNLPSLTLGAVELAPLEVAQMYTTLARMGAGDQVHTLSRVEDLGGKVLFERKPNSEFALPPAESAMVVGMLEQSLIVGTARSARTLGILGAAAGKTGTTSDTKDAWFAGFTPRLLTVVWVGYDDNTVMGLTGAGAALPIWIHLHKELQKIVIDEPFHWPAEVNTRTLTRFELQNKFPALTDLPESLEMVFPH